LARTKTIKIATLVLLAPVLLTILPLGRTKGREEDDPMTVKKITPVLFAENVEPCVKFWVERLGFQKTVEVPDGNKLAFAMLQKGEHRTDVPELRQR